jgi:hypothetical protein
MTFTEAAIEVLRREGKPLHFRKIAEIAAREDLLDHVGKIPEETMAGQLVAHCRLPHTERRLITVQHGTFALAEWGLEEDPAGIENLVEPPPIDEAPYRGRERHPVPSREVARGAGRGEARGRRREEGEEKRGKRFPPPAEVAYEILAGAARALEILEIAAQGAERMLMPDAFVRDAASLRAALQEDNRRRESGGRSPLFALDGDTVTLVAQPEPGERPATTAVRVPASAGDVRKGALAALRRRLRECDGPTFEHLAGVLVQRMGYQELKVVKRGREHAVYTCRKRIGVAEVRHTLRILRTHGEVTRRDIQDLRRDISGYGAQIGIVISTAEVQRDARGDAVAAGQLPVVLLCGDALAEAAAESGTACRAVVVPEVDEAFIQEAVAKAAVEEAARRQRREDREKRDERRSDERRRDAEPREPRREGPSTIEMIEGTPESEPPPAGEAVGDGMPSIIEVRATLDDEPTPAAPSAERDDDEGDEGDEGDDEEGDAVEGAEGDKGAAKTAEGGAPGAEGDGRRRRRRRRRRRGGRGRREGAAQPGAPGSEPASGGADAVGSSPAAPADAPPRRDDGGAGPEGGGEVTGA